MTNHYYDDDHHFEPVVVLFVSFSHNIPGVIRYQKKLRKIISKKKKFKTKQNRKKSATRWRLTRQNKKFSKFFLITKMEWMEKKFINISYFHCEIHEKNIDKFNTQRVSE